MRSQAESGRADWYERSPLPALLRWRHWYFPDYLLCLGLVGLLRHFPWPAGRGRYSFKKLFCRLIFLRRPVPMKTDQGWLFLLPQRDVLQTQIFINGTHYEKEVVALVKRLVKPGMTAIDVGGHIGYYALALARQVGPEGRVIVFEPQGDLCAQLLQSVALYRFSWVSVENSAVADRVGQLGLFKMGDSGRSSLSHIPEARERVIVPCTTLDAYLTEKAITHIDLLKCDIEGGEWLALQGMRELLSGRKISMMVMEVHNEQIRDLGGQPEQIASILEDFGYRVQLIDHRSGLVPYSFKDSATHHLFAEL